MGNKQPGYLKLLQSVKSRIRAAQDKKELPEPEQIQSLLENA